MAKTKAPAKSKPAGNGMEELVRRQRTQGGVPMVPYTPDPNPRKPSSGTPLPEQQYKNPGQLAGEQRLKKFIGK